MNVRDLIRDLVPPVLYRRLQLDRLFVPAARDGRRAVVDWCRSWEEAVAKSTGYDRGEILERTRQAILRVRNGEAAYERDSVTSDTIEYSWPLLAGLMWSAARAEGHLNVLDFGGSLGTSFFQNRRFFAGLRSVRWNIVEQPAYVAVGRRDLQSDTLRFFHSIDECLAETAPNTVVLSGVLPYLADPYALLRQIFGLKGCRVLIDRTAFTAGTADRIGVQRVPPSLYDASYPIRALAEESFRRMLDGIDVVGEFAANDDGVFSLRWRGLLLAVPGPEPGETLPRAAGPRPTEAPGV